MRWRWHPEEIHVRVPFPSGTVSHGRWSLHLWVTRGWRWRARGAYPTGWRNLPPVDGVTAPIYRWWALGPFELRRFRWSYPA